MLSVLHSAALGLRILLTAKTALSGGQFGWLQRGP